MPVAPEDEFYPWLPLATVLAWLKVKPADTPKIALVRIARDGAADWVEDQRPDLLVAVDPLADPIVYVFTATDRVIMGALLATARLVARIDSPNGVVAFAELGAGSILSRDPDVMRQIGSNHKPGLG